jgi:hypothetical protein
MVIDKNYFLGRLANGEDMDAIGQEMAAMMNAAMVEHNANLEAEAKRQAEAEKEAYKRELIEELVEIVQELAAMEGFSGEELEVTEDDINQLIAAFAEMFEAMRELKKMVAALDSAPKVTTKIQTAPVSDDEILAAFAKMLS